MLPVFVEADGVYVCVRECDFVLWRDYSSQPSLTSINSTKKRDPLNKPANDSVK